MRGGRRDDLRRERQVCWAGRGTSGPLTGLSERQGLTPTFLHCPLSHELANQQMTLKQLFKLILMSLQSVTFHKARIGLLQNTSCAAVKMIDIR